MNEERPQKLSQESLPRLSGRELIVLAGLIFDFNSVDFQKRLGIGRNGLEADKGRIADKYQGETKASGLHLAIVDVIRQGLIDGVVNQLFNGGLIQRDIASFVHDPMKKLDEEERAVYDLMFWGFSRRKVEEALKMPEGRAGTVENSICRKLDVKTTYVAVAFLAYEKKRQGRL